MCAVKHKKEKWQPTKLEQRVEGIARRQAARQLMRVPWDRFRNAYLAYRRWHAFALWTQAIVAAEGHTPSWLAAIVRKRCPGFIAKEALTGELGLLPLRLQEWIHKQIFRQAKEEGWLDALIFFGVRGLRSQATWPDGEHGEKQSYRRRPRDYPTFQKWWQTARNSKLCENASVTRVADAVERCVEWQAFASWVRPTLGANLELPAQVAAELDRRYPSFLEFNNSQALGKQAGKGKAWRYLVGWIEDHFFSEAKKQGWFDIVLQQAPGDPRYARMVGYWRRQKQSRSRFKFMGGIKWPTRFNVSREGIKSRSTRRTGAINADTIYAMSTPEPATSSIL
jgi:hypothetical protein